MTIASGGTLGTGGNSTSNNSWSFNTATNTMAAGDFGILINVTDNSSSADGDNNEHTSVTGLTGRWFKLGEHCNSNAGAGNGVVVSAWLFLATGTVSIGSAVTMNYSANRTDKAAAFWKFTKNLTNGIRQAATPVANDTDGAANYGSVSHSGLSSVSRLYVRALAKEVNSTTGLTVSTNFTEITGTRSRNNAAAVIVRGEFRINTSTGETSNPTQADVGDTAGLFFALEEAPSLIFARRGVRLASHHMGSRRS